MEVGARRDRGGAGVILGVMLRSMLGEQVSSQTYAKELYRSISERCAKYQKQVSSEQIGVDMIILSYNVPRLLQLPDNDFENILYALSGILRIFRDTLPDFPVSWLIRYAL